MATNAAIANAAMPIGDDKKEIPEPSAARPCYAGHHVLDVRHDRERRDGRARRTEHRRYLVEVLDKPRDAGNDRAGHELDGAT